MRPARAYSASRALRHLARALVKRGVPVWPLAPVPPAAPAARPPACPMCHGDRACPMAWGEIDDSHWWVALRCGDCEVWNEVVLSNAEAAALDVELDRQMRQMWRAAEQLDLERMEEEAAAFATALRLDLIVAADF
jgi:hypothetical protein